MKLKTALKYQLFEYKKSVIIFYIIVLLVTTLFTSITYVGDNGTFTSNSGIVLSSMIFLFVAGLNSFKETFGMMMQNGISRKVMFVSRLISMAVISTVMALINFVLEILLSNFASTDKVIVTSLYEDIAHNLGAKPNAFIGIIITIILHLSVMTLGYLITIGYYRMNTAAKMAVSVGVPVGLLFILPLLDVTVFGGRVASAIGRIFNKAMGFGSGTPLYMIETFLILIFVFSAISWLLVRRAVDKS